MKVEVSIGEMHRFELRDALLIYRENRRSFITWHTVTAQQQGPPLLGPAQPLTTAFIEDLAESLSGGAVAEVLLESILAKTDRMIAWWTPRRVTAHVLRERRRQGGATQRKAVSAAARWCGGWRMET